MIIGSFVVSVLRIMLLKVLLRLGKGNMLVLVMCCVSDLLCCMLVKMKFGFVVCSVVCVGLLLI